MVKIVEVEFNMEANEETIAAIGAIVGGVRGRRSSKKADASQAQSNQKAATNYNAALLNDYKKAFSVCMEGKGYTIK